MVAACNHVLAERCEIPGGHIRLSVARLVPERPKPSFRLFISNAVELRDPL